jgi:hypothetical protein
MIEAMPQGYVLAVVSDHGFEKVDAEVNLGAFAAKKGIAGVRAMGGIVLADTPAAAEFLRETAKDSRYGIGRPIPKDELKRFAPQYASAAEAFESAPGFMFSFGPPEGEIFGKPREIGNHGHWPMRYRSVYMLWGSGIRAQKLPEISSKDIAGRLASVVGVPFTPAAK